MPLASVRQRHLAPLIFISGLVFFSFNTVYFAGKGSKPNPADLHVYRKNREIEGTTPAGVECLVNIDVSINM